MSSKTKIDSTSVRMKSRMGNGLVRRDPLPEEFGDLSAEVQWRFFDSICFTLLPHHGGGIDPSWTTLRAVSGKNSNTGIAITTVREARNQKIACQPKCWVSRPPKTGELVRSVSLKLP